MGLEKSIYSMALILAIVNQFSYIPWDKLRPDSSRAEVTKVRPAKTFCAARAVKGLKKICSSLNKRLGNLLSITKLFITLPNN